MNLSLEFLLNASDQTLMDSQLASLDRGTRHLKAARVSWNAAIEEFVNAELALIFRERKEEIMEQARRTIDGQATIPFPARKSA